jgi:predicted Zn-dependent protease
VLYTNLYRCGDLCLPSGVRVRTAEDHVMLGKAIEDRDDGREVSAARMLSAYTERLPDDELARHIQMETAMRMGDMATASQAAAAALRIAPFRTTNKVHSALTHLMAGHRDEAWAVQRTLAAAAPTPQHPGWPAARCVESLLLGADGRRQEAQVAGEEACSAGFELCCPDEPPVIPG